MVQQVEPADFTSVWKHPLEKDGWYRAHDALRADMSALEGMLARFKAQLAAGKPITQVQAAAADRFFKCHLKFFHHHHTNEDDVAIPYMAKRCSLPDKVSTDHKKLEVLLDRLEAQMGQLLTQASSLAEQQPALEAAAATFSEMHSLCLQHLREEEEEVLPLMRRYFTPKEVAKDVVARIMRSMDSDGLGTFFRTMGREERREFARQEGIPFFVRWIIFHQAGKYERNVWQPFERECLQGAAA